MTDEQIIKALDICNHISSCQKCPYYHNGCKDNLLYDALALINRQNAEIEKLEKDAKEVRYKFDCLLCHSTGGRLSKSTYPLRTMETAVTDYINECYDEVEAEARAEAVKEFAERLKEKAYTNNYCQDVLRVDDIDNLVKEFRKKIRRTYESNC